MIYLLERNCGYDADGIGFPSVESCMAVVVETASRLVGWHVVSQGVDKTRASSPRFADYVAEEGNGAPISLYGVTHPSRDNAKVNAPEELRAIAGALAFRGLVACVVLYSNRADYIEFRRIGGGTPCEIYYKNSSEELYVKGKVRPDETTHRSIVGEKPAELLFAGTGGATIVTGVTVTATAGPLVRVSHSSLIYVIL